TAANVQNTANSAASQNGQLSTSMSNQLQHIQDLLRAGFAQVNADLRRSFHNHRIAEEHHQAYDQRFAAIEQQLTRLGVQPHSPQPRVPRGRAVPQLEEAAAAAAPPAPPVPPPSRQIIDVLPSPHRPQDEPDMVAGKAPPPSKLSGKMEKLEGWLLQMDNYFTITRTRNERQRLAFVGLSTEGDALEWWKPNRHRHDKWEDVKDTIRVYYGDHYRSDKAYNEIVAIHQTGTVQKYRTQIDRLNVYAGMTDHHLINIILNRISSRLRISMAHYEDLRQHPNLWRQKLLEMDVATTEFQQKDRDSKSKDKGKKRSFEDRIQLRGGAVPKEKKEGEYIPIE